MLSFCAAPMVILLLPSGGRREAGLPLRAAHPWLVQQ
jgi:hypothetical protein